jgi:hypothetical protein
MFMTISNSDPVGTVLASAHTASAAPNALEITVTEELQARAEEVFGPVETIRLDDTRPVGAFFDDVRKALKEPYPNSIIAVPCGGQPALCAIMVNMDEDPAPLTALLKENNWLHDTVWTTWNNFVLLWLRVEGWCPATRNLSGIGWMGSECLLPVADVPVAGHPGDFLVAGKGAAILAVKFEQIVWPASVAEIFLLKRLESEHGALFQQNEERRIIFGEVTAAHFFAERLGLKYARNDNTFTMIADGKTELIPKSNLHKIISDWLRARAIAAGIPYPSDAPVNMVLDQLKLLCVVERIDEAEGLQLFLSERLELKPGFSVSSAELFSGYREFCQARGAVCFAERSFHKRATVAIRERLGLCKNHCVQRSHADGSAALKYGFRNLALKGA